MSIDVERLLERLSGAFDWRHGDYDELKQLLEDVSAALGASSDRPDAGNAAERSHAPHGATAVDGGRTAPVLPGSPEPSGDARG